MRRESTFFCRIEHVADMIILGLFIVLAIIDPEIHRHNRGSIRPKERDHIDSFHHLLMFSAPMIGHSLNLVRI